MRIERLREEQRLAEQAEKNLRIELYAEAVEKNGKIGENWIERDVPERE